MKRRLVSSLLLGLAVVANTSPAYAHGGMAEGEPSTIGGIGTMILVALAGYLIMVWDIRDIPKLFRGK